jgi:hypothetical protein
MDTTGKTLTSTEEIVLKNDLLDIQDWVDNALLGKINNCKKRMIAEWQPKLTADATVESIPADDDKLIALIVKRDDYKTRAERDAASEAAGP